MTSGGFYGAGVSRPRIIDKHGNPVNMLTSGITVPINTSSTQVIGHGSVISLSSGDAVLTAGNGTTGDTTGIVLAVFDSNGNEFRDGFHPGSAGNPGYCEILLWSDGYKMIVTEDGDGGVISTSNSSGYCDIIQSNDGTTGQERFLHAIMDVRVDSSEFNTSAGSLNFQVRVHNSNESLNMQPAGNSGTLLRTWLIEPTSGNIVDP